MRISCLPIFRGRSSFSAACKLCYGHTVVAIVSYGY